jgi:hypothetical protein
MFIFLLALLTFQLLSPGSSEPLQGSVEESRALARWQSEVLPTIKVGSVWSDAMLPQERTEEVWFWVPPWKAGELTGDVATEYEFVEGKRRLVGMHKNRFDLLSGQQQDAAGGIWHCARFPNVSTVEGDDRITTVIGLASQHVQKSPDKEFVGERSVEIARRRDTGRILSVKEVESRAYWTPGKDGSLLFVQQSLGADGQPLREGRVIVECVSPFRRVNRLADGFDLRASFRRFLQSQGRPDLLPTY